MTAEYYIDPTQPGIVRGGHYDDMGGMLVGTKAELICDILNAHFNQFTSVTDALPDYGRKLIIFSNGVVQEETYEIDRHPTDECGDGDGGHFWTRDNLDECVPVTDDDCWMYLPGLPVVG
jgi:hypothetical protein